MCVILHCRRKDLLKEAELRKAMRENPAGFFLAALYKDENGVAKRDIVRTMDGNQAVEFWQAQPVDREMVMHFRIPSRGMDRTVDNVHGWEEDGILFCHNMTIHQIDDMMSRVKWKGTDSEFFFRKIFMPMYRGFGKHAYCAGRFCDDLDNIVRFFCGHSNRFCFVMPDNTVIRYGDWAGNDATRKVGDEPGFFASNTSYVVYERAWPEKGGTGTMTVSGFRRGHEELVGYRYWDTSQMGKAVQSKEEEEDEVADDRGPAGRPEVLPSSAASADDDFDGSVALSVLGDTIVLRLALADVVISNYIALLRQLKLRSPADIALFETLRPKWFTPNTTKAAEDAIRCFYGQLTSEATADAIVTYAAGLESQLGKYFPGAVYPPQRIDKARLRDNYNELAREIALFCSVAFIDLNWKATDAEDFLHVFTLEHSKRKNRPYIDEIVPDDIFVPDDSTSEEALGAVGNMLKAIRLLSDGHEVEDIDGLVL